MRAFSSVRPNFYDLATQFLRLEADLRPTIYGHSTQYLRDGMNFLKYYNYLTADEEEEREDKEA